MSSRSFVEERMVGRTRSPEELLLDVFRELALSSVSESFAFLDNAGDPTTLVPVDRISALPRVSCTNGHSGDC